MHLPQMIPQLIRPRQSLRALPIALGHRAVVPLWSMVAADMALEIGFAGEFVQSAQFQAVWVGTEPGTSVMDGQRLSGFGR